MTENETSVAIVGAGITGISAYLSLKSHHVSSVILEKSRGLGGRMSTRRGPSFLADLGAQYTSARSPDWAETVSHLGKPLWIPGESHFPRFVYGPGMSKLVGAALGEQNRSSVLLEHRARRILNHGSHWLIECENGAVFKTRAVLLTAPLPQALELIEKSDLQVSSHCLSELSSIQYWPCLALALVLSHPLGANMPPILKNPSPRIDGIFDQQKKGLWTEAPVLVVHANGNFSVELWDMPESEIIDRLLKEVLEVSAKYSFEIEPEKTLLHRWRYCEPRQVHPERFYAVSLDRSPHPPLVVAGDSFGVSSVDGAFTSGQAAAEFLSAELLRVS